MVEALGDKKGEDILLMDIIDIASFADYFVICNGTSDRMLNSLAEEVLDTAKKLYGVNATIEGTPIDGWLVVDLAMWWCTCSLLTSANTMIWKNSGIVEKYWYGFNNL